MKTLMSALLGLSLLAAVPVFAQDKSADPKTKVHKAKKVKKDKKDKK